MSWDCSTLARFGDRGCSYTAIAIRTEGVQLGIPSYRREMYKKVLRVVKRLAQQAAL